MENYNIQSLNEMQQKALTQTEGVVLVTAGAGSGKTRLLTHRICYLIDTLKVSPYNILAITFTNKATNEMKERVRDMCGLNVWISTFHSMCVRILRQEIDHLDGYDKNFTIIAEADRDKILKELCKNVGLEDEDIAKASAHLDRIKNKGLDASEYFCALAQNTKIKDLKKFEEVVYAYEKRLRENNSLDFDDLLNKTLFLFNNYPDVLKKYAMRFQYVLVDEFQDTNLVQYKLVKLLVSEWGNLFVVGDEDQCIYSWRGANFENIFNLKKDFPNLKTFKLEQNYRSSKNILKLANNVIKNNRERLDKSLWTDNDDGLPPVVYSAFDERDEALFIAREIENLVSEGHSYDDFAILMRLNALSRPLEEGLLSYNIPYKVYGGLKFFERAEIKICLAYLSIFINPKDEISLFKTLAFPKKGVGEVGLKKLKAEAGDKGVLEYMLSAEFEKSRYYGKLYDFITAYRALKTALGQVSMEEFVKKIVHDFRIDIAYSGKDEESVNKLSNIDSFISSVKEYEEQTEDASFVDYLQSVMLRSDQDEILSQGAVSISTIHAVKGLEFKVVFVVGLEEGMFPLSRALNSQSELEEERRLMYVALTRAEEKIYVTHVNKRYMYGKTSYQTESRFVKELNIVEKSKPRVTTKRRKDDFFVEEKQTFSSNFCAGDKVTHPKFGEGVIQKVSQDGFVATINFEDFGVKELMLNIAPLEKVESENE